MTTAIDNKIRRRLKPCWRAVAMIFAMMMVALQVNATPNIITIVVDHFGRDSYDALLSAGLLPNIKLQLVDKGVSFNNSYVSSGMFCSSRASFLTGQYAHNHQVYSNNTPHPLKQGISWEGWFTQNETAGRNESTIATTLQAANYRTGFVGKHFNGYGVFAPPGYVNPATYIPPGWSSWSALLEATAYSMYDYQMNQDGGVVSYGSTVADYQTDILAKRASAFLQQALVSTQPFFLLVSPLASHVELLDPLAILSGNDPRDKLTLTTRPAPRHAYLIDEDSGNGEIPDLPSKPSLNESDLSDKPSCPSPPPPVEPGLQLAPLCNAEMPELEVNPHIENLESQYKSMQASMLAVDDLVGALVAQLEAGNALDETVIVFTSNNGWLHGEHRRSGPELPYEEVIHVPLVIRYPGGAQSATAQQMVLNNDLAPTFAALAMTSLSHQADGESLAPLLIDPESTSWHRKAFLVERWFLPNLSKFEGPTSFTLRWHANDNHYSYISSHTDQENLQQATHHEFYPLKSDPYQLDSIPLPAEITSILDDFLLQFRVCGGSQCRAYEAL